MQSEFSLLPVRIVIVFEMDKIDQTGVMAETLTPLSTRSLSFAKYVGPADRIAKNQGEHTA